MLVDLISQSQAWLGGYAIAKREILKMRAGIEHKAFTEFVLPCHIAFEQVAESLSRFDRSFRTGNDRLRFPRAG